MKIKKELTLLLIFLLIPFAFAQEGVGVTIQVITGPPSINILSPQNITYSSNQNLLLNYTITNEDTIWYNLDNGPNITITSPTLFNTSFGQHILYLFAQNAQGTSVANVTFSIIAPPSPPPSGGGGGSGGGGSGGYIIDFQFQPFELSTSLNQGEITSQNVLVTNTGTVNLDNIQLTTTGADGLILLGTNTLSLNEGESKYLTINFFSNQLTKPDIYLGKIIGTYNNIDRELPITLEVESTEPLFDVVAQISDKGNITDTTSNIDLEVIAGENLFSRIKIINLGNVGANATIEYAILTSEGTNILYETQEVYVDDELMVERNFKIPDNSNSGKHIFYVKVTSGNKVASSSVDFQISSNKFCWICAFWIVLIISIIVLIILISKRLREIHKHKKYHGKKMIQLPGHRKKKN